MIVANPVYDIVFKYLMEDERIARTILSALLKKDVVAVEVRPHEYSDDSRDSLSVFRIDFGATIRESDGKEHLILIELQKTWLDTETLRFRQYLGVHYSNPKNMLASGHALPMVAVYLLGHRVGDIEEPVLYVSHRACDYNDNVVTKGLPNAFVDSLTHDSIIVQVPRLHGRINNRLDEVLSVFDQSQANEENQHTLLLDERRYDEDDRDMQLILRRLLEAAASSDMRYEMNVEDEYFSQLEKNETDLLIKDKEIAEQRAQLAEKNAELTAQKTQLAEKNAELSAQKTKLMKSIQMLHNAGLSPEAIAESLGEDVETVRILIAS